MAPMTSSTIHTRLRRLSRETGLTQADIARITGADASTVSKWFTDGHKQIDSLYAFRLQDATGFCARWILHGEGPVHQSEPVADAMPDALRREMLRHAHAVVKIFSEATQS